MEFVGFSLRNNLFVAPMAGVTDRPFRQLCKKMGAGLAVSEMVTSNSLLYGSAKTQRRANHDGEVEPISVQIAGSIPEMMAQAARHNVDRGAQIIDINMGCPAKKICNVMAGSALLRDEPLVGRILAAVVAAVPDTPVTLKIRTGWDKRNRKSRRLDFTSRYGYAPDMTEGASKVWLVHDPLHGPDAAHAALFRRSWVTMLRARRTGDETEKALIATGTLDRLIEEAVAGSLDVTSFARAWRARRSYHVYLKTLLSTTVQRGRTGLEIRVCRSVSSRMHAPRYARRLEELTAG